MIDIFCLNLDDTTTRLQTVSDESHRQQKQQQRPGQVPVDQQSRLQLAEWYARRDQFNKAFSQYWRILNSGN